MKKGPLLLFLFFLYFFSIITGRPDLFGPGAVSWSPGLLQEVMIQSTVLDELNDPLLESDAKPDNLFRSIGRSLTSDQTMLFLASFWSVLILLCMVAGIKEHWFYVPMKTLLIGSSTIALLIILLIGRNRQLIMATGDPVPVQLMIGVAVETVLLFTGIAVVLRELLPIERNGRAFLDFLQKPAGSLKKKTASFLTVLFQLMIIALAGLFISNFIVLPAYRLQMSFPGFFAAVLAFGLILLALFYIFSYYRVSKMTGESPSYPSSAAFLGFRMLRNTLFIAAIFAAVVSVITLVVVIAVFNIDSLQTFGALPKNPVF